MSRNLLRILESFLSCFFFPKDVSSGVTKTTATAAAAATTTTTVATTAIITI